MLEFIMIIIFTGVVLLGIYGVKSIARLKNSNHKYLREEEIERCKKHGVCDIYYK